MEVPELVRAILAGDLLAARQWVADAERERLSWQQLDRPKGLDALELSVAAGMVELLASRAGTEPPSWTNGVGGQPEEVVLDPGLEEMPRSFALAKAQGPEPLRKRNFVALPDFLRVI